MGVYMGFFKIPRYLGLMPALLILSTFAFGGGVKDSINQTKNAVMQKAYSYGDSAIESWASFTQLELMHMIFLF